MAFSQNSAGDYALVSAPYNLQTQQKRLRHLKSISVHNLHIGGLGQADINKQQCYFSLHTGVKRPAFYHSEKLNGSMNLSWQSFDVTQYNDQVDLTTKFFVVRIWVGQDGAFRLLIEMEVHLSGLHFLDNKLHQVYVRRSPNIVVFGLLDKEFVFVNREQSRIKNLIKKVADFELQLTLPSVIKVEQSATRNSYSASSLIRVQTVLRAIKQLQAHAKRHRRMIEDKMHASQENAQKLAERERLQMSVSQLRQELLRRTNQQFLMQDRLRSLQEAAMATAKQHTKNVEELQEAWKVLEEDKRDYIVKREKLVKENALLNLRRRQLLSELFSFIYPITEENGKYYINGVHLPQAEQFQGQDEQMIAVALGYTCHLTLKISQILRLPLRHPMENRGSKSVIYDQVHARIADKEREFPLFSKGKDKFNFNYGVFLLNKNISQLRYQCSLPTIDLRQSLENLLKLMHKLGVMRTDGATGLPATVSTPEDTTLSCSSNTGPDQSFQISREDDLSRTPGSRSTQPPSKLSDFSEDASSLATTDNPAARNKEMDDGQEAGELDNPPPAATGKPEEQGRFDECEEIFQPADDHFFTVSSMSVMEAFNCGDAEGDQSSCHGNHTDAVLSALLDSASQGESLAPTQSFQLFKQKQSSGKDSGSGDIENNTPEGDGLNGCGGYSDERDWQSHHSSVGTDTDCKQQDANSRDDIGRDVSYSTLSDDRSVFNESIKIVGTDINDHLVGGEFS